MVQVYYPNNVYHLGIVMIGIGIVIRYLSGEYPNGFGYKSIISQKIVITGKKAMSIQVGCV